MPTINIFIKISSMYAKTMKTQTLALFFGFVSPQCIELSIKTKAYFSHTTIREGPVYRLSSIPISSVIFVFFAERNILKTFSIRSEQTLK